METLDIDTRSDRPCDKCGLRRHSWFTDEGYLCVECNDERREREKKARTLALRRRIQQVVHGYFDGKLFLAREDEHRSRADLVSDLVKAVEGEEGVRSE